MISPIVDNPGAPAAGRATHQAEPTEPAEPLVPMPRMAWGIAVALGVLLVATADRYGWHRDELYFREAGRHLAWGYVDQPPFTPFVARVADVVAPDNLVVLRLLPALACVATVVLGALIVRELGGGRQAQVAAAAVTASAGFVMGSGHLLATPTFDCTAWLAVLWLVTRMLRTGNPRWWVAIGGVAGAAMLNKNLVLMLLAALVAAMVVDRRRDVLATRWAVIGGAVALAVAAPHLIWQATNGWPQLEMARALSERLGGENRSNLLPQQVLLVGFVALWLWPVGARWLAGDPAGRRFRPVLWAWPIGLAAVFVTGGRPYYAVPLSLVVALAGVRALDDRVTGLRWPLAIGAAVTVLLVLPVLPISAARITGEVNETTAETIGWPELTAEVKAVVDDLPREERDHVVILTASYGEAGAVDRFGPALGLPPAYSAHNGYYDFRRPTDDTATVVAVRYPPVALAPYFARCTQVGRVDNGRDVDNEAQGTPLVVCRGLREPWSQTWPRLRHVD